MERIGPYSWELTGESLVRQDEQCPGIRLVGGSLFWEQRWEVRLLDSDHDTTTPSVYELQSPWRHKRHMRGLKVVAGRRAGWQDYRCRRRRWTVITIKRGMSTAELPETCFKDPALHVKGHLNQKPLTMQS